MTDTEQALLAAIAAQPGEDTPRLMLADYLDENAGRVECPTCKGKGDGVMYADSLWPGERCRACKGTGTVPDEPADRAELIRVQVELVKWLEVDYNRIGDLQRRQSALIEKHPEWRPACPVCEGEKLVCEKQNGGWACIDCSGTGRVGGTLTRGFLESLTVPTLATVLENWCHSECQTCPMKPTPWASDLVRNRDRWPLLNSVLIADRQPEDIGYGFCWRDEGLENGPENVPDIVFQDPECQLVRNSPDAALAALGAVVWRVLVKLCAK
jgi:uncharacterized protein (TIGR02996 family)